MKHTVIDNEYGSLSFEEYEGQWLVHCDIYKWSLSLYKEYLEVWRMVLEEVKAKGVDVLWAVFSADSNTDKFAAMFGMGPVTPAIDKETGEKRWVYKIDVDEVVG